MYLHQISYFVINVLNWYWIFDNPVRECCKTAFAIFAYSLYKYFHVRRKQSFKL